MRARMPGRAPSSSGDMAAVRKGLEAMWPRSCWMLKQYPVDVVDQAIEGIPTASSRQRTSLSIASTC